MTDRAAFRPAVGLAWSAGRATAVGFAVAVLASAVAPVAGAWLTRTAIDAVATGRIGSLPAVAAALALTGAAAGLLPHLVRYLRQSLQRRAALLAQDRLFAATERLVGLARFEDPAFLDRLRLAQDSGGATPVVALATVLETVRSLVVGLGFIGSLLLVGPWMAGFLLLAAVPAVAAELRLSRARAAVLWQLGPVERRELFYRQLLTSVPAATELRLFGLGPYFRRQMGDQRRTADAARTRLDRRELRTQLALGLIAAGVAGSGLVWALLAAGRGSLTVGDVALFTAAVAGVQATVGQLVGELALAQGQLMLFRHYVRIVSAPPDLVVPSGARTVAPLRRGLEFNDVWFRYSPQLPWVLAGASFTIPYGQSLGLVGRNGAGKSTVVKLVCRLYDPERGSVTWDGVDLRELDPAALRERIGPVMQEFMRYDLSARENIGLGDLTAPSDSILAAAGRAGVDDTLAALPRGYDTLLSRLFVDTAPADDPAVGVSLSGGQWQRVALARGLLRHRRDLLILDEPSSGLDAEAEYEVHTALRALRAGATTLLISHRLSALREADQIVVLDGGTVAERGDHDSLLALGGVYARLYALQARGYEVPA